MAMIRPETEMKDSGIKWVGLMPVNWKTVRIKNLPNQEENSFVDGDWIESSYITDSGIRYYTTGNIGDGKFKEQGNGYISENTFNELKCKYAFPGDLVLSRLNEPYGRSCIIPETEPKCIVAVDNVILRTNEDKRYICYITQCDGYHAEVGELARGTAMKRVSRTNLGTIRIPLPAKIEQQSIADYLDEICSKIDEIIAEAKASIDEYKELKQSVITQTVTMNNHTKLMETGNKILPKLPISWNLVRIKNLFSNEEKPLRVGPFGSQLTTKDYLDSGYWVYTQRNVLDNNFATNDIFISDEKYEELKAFAVKENDILITTRGSGTPGHVAKVPHNYKKGILHPCLIRFRLDEDKCLYEYLRFVFEFSTYIREQIDSASNTTAIPVLYSDTLKNLYMPLPSIEEQKEIIEKLITFEKKIDSLIAEKKSLINDLEAYKKSLIYEVVTGKRRVV